MINRKVNKRRRKSKKQITDKLKKQNEEKYNFEEETIRELNKQLEKIN